ncbi:MAG TPA: FKBP-type peptidyl-prolyl cis-trans isomerase [Chitinophagaceae bacterium]|nr:FKBP-type peptidyl-prolyl cis-trans isomerase [Chitinophagaceae bacterium]
MRTFSRLIVVFLVLGFLASCIKKPEPIPCTYDACAVKAPANEIAAVQQYLDSAGITGTTQHCSGLFYTIQTPGTGLQPDACSGISVKYKGKLTNGEVFDSSATYIDIALGQVIRGWANGLPLLKEGGKMTLYIPPSLGYGSEDVRDRNNVLKIPANSILIFDVELLKVY